MSSEAKLVWRTTALSISAFTSGYFAPMIDDGKGTIAIVGCLFALGVCIFIYGMIIFDMD